MSDQERLMNSMKKVVRSLLTPVKEGLTPMELNKEYKSMIGEPLPFRALGYRSVMELVMDMPDVVSICPSGNGNTVLRAIPDESTELIASLVARQKSKPKPYFSRGKPNFSFNARSCSGLPQPPRISLPRRGRVSPTLPAVVKSELKELLRSSPVLLSDFDKAFSRHFGRKFEFMRFGFFSMLEVLNAASDIITVVQTRAGSLLTLKPSIKKNPEKLPECKAVIPSHKTKQTLPTTLPAPAVKKSSTPALPMDNQNPSPSQESDALVVELKPVETPLVRTDERMKQLEKEMQIALSQKGPGGTIGSELKEKIKTRHFKEILAVKKLGFLNLMELVGALSDVLHIECKEGEQDWRIFDIESQCLRDDEHASDKIAQPDSLAHEETPDVHELLSWNFPLEESKAPDVKLSVVTKMTTPHLGIEDTHIIQEIMENEIPPDAVQDRSLYSLPQLDTSALVGLFVEYIVSPSQFYVRIYSAETSVKLENMMLEMRRCYSSKHVADRYIMPEASISPGQLCCIKNSEDKWWYRVIIHRVLNDQEVEVFYPDFGSTRTAQKSSLRFLKSCYAKLPAQAIPCSLAWVRPTEDNWTASDIHEFQRLCELKLLVGVVDEYIDGILYLFLCDTSSDEDIYLHNALRLKGHAFICRENLPSKNFREPFFSTLYLKPGPEQQSGLTKAETPLLTQESLCDLPEVPDSGSCYNEVLSQSTADPEMPLLEPVYMCDEIWDENWTSSKHYEEEKNGDTLSPDNAVFPRHSSSDEGYKEETQHNQELTQQNFREPFFSTLYLKPGPEQQSGLTKAETPLLTQESLCDLSEVPDSGSCYNEVLSQGTAGSRLGSEMPLLEPVYMCDEIWDENWTPSKHYEEEKNGDTLSPDNAVFPCHSSSDEGNEEETQHSQELTQQNVDISIPFERTNCLSLEPLNRKVELSGRMEARNTLGATSDSLSQTLQEFYISIVHSKQSAEENKLDLDLNKLSGYGSQPLPSPSAIHGNVPSERKVDDASRTQVITLYTARSCPNQGGTGHNALVFTAKLQGSPASCVACSPSVALGASARLATSGGFFSFHLKKMAI
ncbi:Tudor domain-containing protein 5 [Podarcis lilfordi]|uniref:Tudor domain-containing protein 5 n=1 Tax=Podarcis lilfordi TaxID=74358 RepID=A0AA35P8T9_9SAUR|nr:Tudor domain-containing protein 5 [Podarcis lilfordi]